MIKVVGGESLRGYSARHGMVVRTSPVVETIHDVNGHQFARTKSGTLYKLLKPYSEYLAELQQQIVSSELYTPTDRKEYSEAAKKLMALKGLSAEEFARLIDKPVDWVKKNVL